MSLVLDYGLSFDEARARGADVYNVWLDIWGSRFGPPDPLVLGVDSYPDWTTPPLPASIAGIAIGPESDVNRVWLSSNLAKPTPDTAVLQFAIREVSVEAPLLYTQAAKIDRPLVPGGSTFAQSRGDLYVFAEDVISGFKCSSTVIPEFYLDAAGNQQTLNSFPGGINFDLIYPRLHLQLILKDGVLPSTKRSPRRWGNVDNATTAISANPGEETRIHIIPIYGRKNISIQMAARSQPAGAAGLKFTFRAAVIRTLGYLGLVQEETVGQKTATTTANGCSTSFHICDPGADFLILYCSSELGGGRLTSWIVDASD